MNSNFTGFNTKEVTLAVSGNVTAGAPVKLTAGGDAAPCASAEKFCGICSAVREGYASVIMTGYAVASYSGTAPSVGFNKLAANGNGSVTVNENGKEYLVVSVDTTEKIIEILI